MRSVLIVSADPSASAELSAHFEPVRWRVERVLGVKGALTAGGFRSPDLVVLHHSVGPPHEILPELTAGPSLGGRPVIVVVEASVADPALPEGMVGRVLAEPFSRKKFLSLVESLTDDYEVVEIEQKEPPQGTRPREIPEQSPGLPLLFGPEYIRSLSRALIVWESEVSLVRGQRDRARDAFSRLRNKAVSIEAERKRLREELQQVTEELTKLRAERAGPTLADLDESLLGDVLGLGEEDTQPEIDTEPLSDDVLDELEASDRETARLFGDSPLQESLRQSVPPLPPAEALAGVSPPKSAADAEKLASELEEVREEADRAWAECDELTVRLGEAEDRLAAAAASRESAESARDELQERVEAAEEKAAELREQIEARDDELAGVKDALVKLEAELEQSKKRAEQVERELAEGGETARRVESEAAELREALSEALAEKALEASAARQARERAEQAEQEAREARDALAARADAPETEPKTEPETGEDAGVGFVESLAARLEEVKKDSERWEAKAARLKASLGVARAEADAARQEADELKGEVQELREAAEKAGPAPPGLPPRRVVSLDDVEDEASPSPWMQLDEDGEDALEAALRAAHSAVGEEPYEPRPQRRPRREDAIPVTIEPAAASTPSHGPVAVDSGELERLRARIVSLESERKRLLDECAQQAQRERDMASRLGGDGAMRRGDHAGEDVVAELRNQLAQLRLERDLARQRLSRAESGQAGPAGGDLSRERAIASALSLTNTRLGELPAIRRSGQQRQRAWQEILTRVGQQVSELLKTVGCRPELAEAGVRPEALFDGMKRLAAESGDLFGDREGILAREETVLKILKDRLGEARSDDRQEQVPDRQPPTEPVRRR